MINKILQFFGALFLVLIPVLVGYYLTRASPDVRYTLSEKIPVTFAQTNDSSPETVQQLEVKNVGNAQANQIIVKINGQITNYSLDKHSAADRVQLFDERQPFEIVYSELPPQAGFQLVFTSPGNGIDDANLDISHDTGVAEAALSKSNQRSTIVLAVYWFVAGYYIVHLSRTVRKDVLDSWKSTARRRDPKQILQMKRPWYVFDSEWANMPIDSLKKSVVTEPAFWDEDLRTLSAYQLLDLDLPELDENPIYKEAIELAINKLQKAYEESSKSAYRVSQIIDLLRVNKPIRFPLGPWQDLEKQANEHYVVLRKKESFYDYKDVYKRLQEAMPGELKASTWDELLSFWRDQYAEYLRRELMRSDKPLEFAEKADLSMLEEANRFWWDRLVSQMHRADEDSTKYSQLLFSLRDVFKGSMLETRPENIDEWEWSRIKELEQRFQEHIADVEKTKGISDLLENLLQGKPLGETKPTYVKDYEWITIKDYESLLIKLRDAENLQKQSRLESIEISAEKAKIADLKEKLERQLRFIHELLNDPTMINRVEKHDNTFADGNWANLQAIARLLNKPKRSV